MLPVNCGSHADYQNFVLTNLRKYYPNPNALARSTWDIIERFWNLNLSFTDTFMADKYSKMGRIHFVHLRNVCWVEDNYSFYESGHYSQDGSLPINKIVKALVKNA